MADLAEASNTTLSFVVVLDSLIMHTKHRQVKHGIRILTWSIRWHEFCMSQTAMYS